MSSKKASAGNFGWTLPVSLVAMAIVAVVAFKKKQQPASPTVSRTMEVELTQPSVSDTPPAAAADANMLLGNPSSATSDSANRDNYLMIKPYYCLSYNSGKGIPNWVSWKVDLSDLGKAPRKQTFDADETLPAGFRRVQSADYGGSGFDRGHMCPHSDRAASKAMSYSTFVMTNIIPQAPNVNQQAWADLEEYCRRLVAKENQHLYIVSGPAGQGGVGSKGRATTIGQSDDIVVPAKCWKIIVCVPASGGEDDRSKISASTRVITVIMPNDNAVSQGWEQYRTSPQQVEQETGYTFFANLPTNVAQTLRKKTDRQ